MNIPTGSPVERGREVPKINPRKYMHQLMDQGFRGYNSITIHGETGLEEGTIIYRNGEIISGDYVYFRYNKQYQAEEGIKRALNALRSRNGVIDTYSLTSHQVELILTLNEDCTLREPISKDKLQLPSHFTRDYEEKLIKKKTQELSRDELLRKYGLTALQTSRDTGGQLIQKAREERRSLEKFLKEKR